MKLETKSQINILLSVMMLSSLFGTALFNLTSVIFIIKITYEIFKNKDSKYFNQTWFKLTCILFIVFILSSLQSEYLNLIIFKVLPFFRFILLALCIQYCFQKYQNINIFLFWIVVMTTFVSIDSLIQYVFEVNLFGNNLNVETITRIRLTSIFGEEEIVGSFLIKFICLGIAGTVLFFQKHISVVYIYYLLIGAIILLSQERMAFLLLGLTTFIILIYSFLIKNIKISFSILIISFLSISTVFMLDKSLKARYLSIFTSGSGIAKVTYDDSNKPVNLIENFSDLKDVDLSFRDSMWGAHFITAYQIFRENIILGSGARSFRYECNKEKYDNIDIHYIKKRCSTHPHNYYLEILSENGIIGFAYLLLLLSLFYYYEIKFFLKNKNLLHLFGILSIFINLWPIASTGSIYASFNGLVIWMSIGFIFSFSKKIN